MSCDDERCLPPKEIDFEFAIQGATIKPQAEIAAVPNTSTEVENMSVDMDTTLSQVEKDPTPQTVESENAPLDTKESKESLWLFFLVAFIAGLAAILTPCVFPMIPMTVTFFMRGKGSRLQGILKGLIFGTSIVLIYTSIGFLVSLTSAGADVASVIATHWIPNLLFFLLFVVFAASFFGMFELVLPSSLVNKADSKVDKGGYLASFFMALTLVIVSFSCTGPIVGALLVESAGGLAIKPILGMFGFSLAFALPFTLFAVFPSWLKNLPKSGGWLNSIKVVLGFVILAFSLKFLSSMDQSYHLGLLSRDVYLAIWIVLFTLLGLYLLGKIKFSHDSELQHIGFPRLMLSIAAFSFALYLVPGLFGAPLTRVAALLPPATSQKFDVPLLIRQNASATGILSSDPSTCGTPMYSDFLKLPHGLKGYFDYEEGMECARKLNKPVFLDFNGHSCSNCKLMEARVWTNPEVLRRLREDYVIIALYIDDKTRLPENEWVVSSFDGKEKRTIGAKNLDFQISRFNINSQPYYVLLDHSGKELNKAMGLNLDPNAFIEFLDEGKSIFETR
jgi:thiol:disulfide interchange protein